MPRRAGEVAKRKVDVAQKTDTRKEAVIIELTRNGKPI